MVVQGEVFKEFLHPKEEIVEEEEKKRREEEELEERNRGREGKKVAEEWGEEEKDFIFLYLPGKNVKRTKQMNRGRGHDYY